MAACSRALELALWRGHALGDGEAAGAPLGALWRLAGDAAVIDALAAGGDGEHAALRARLLARRLLRARLRGDAEIVAREGACIAARRRLAGEDAAALAALRAPGASEAAREAAWLRRAQLGASLVAPLQALVAARRRLAAADGAARALAAVAAGGGAVSGGFHALALAAEGLDAATVAGAAAELEAASAPAWQALRERERLERPWQLFAAERPGAAAADADPDDDVIAAALAARGLPPAAARHDEPAAGADCATYVIDAPADVRVVAPEPRDRASRARLWHERGHALHAAAIDPALPWSLRDAPAPWFGEAVAIAVARLAVPDTREQTITARLRLAHAGFERELYAAGAGADEPAALWSAQMRGALGFFPDHPAAAPAWARLGHLATHPGGLASYLVAEPAAARVLDGDAAARLRAGALAWLPRDTE